MKRSARAEYRVWAAMLRRCRNRTAADYPRYGGRGIVVCHRWLKFDNFIADMGARPSPEHSLDRIDNDGPYEPANVRWASRIEQANNKRNSRMIEYRGASMTLADAVRAAGSVVDQWTARCRLKNRWTIEDAVETPPLFRRDPKTRKIVEPFPSCAPGA